VTVLALESKTLDVMLVAERYRLVRPLTLPRHPRGALQLVQGYAERDHDYSRQNQAESGQRVRTAVKNLRHEYVPASSALPELRVEKLLSKGCVSYCYFAEHSESAVGRPRLDGALENT